MSVGEKIKTRRIEEEMSQEELARLVQVTQSMICQIERGSKVPTLILASEIAKALHCTVSDLV